MDTEPLVCVECGSELTAAGVCPACAFAQLEARMADRERLFGRNEPVAPLLDGELSALEERLKAEGAGEWALAYLPRLIHELHRVRYEIEHAAYYAFRAARKPDPEGWRTELAVISHRIEVELAQFGWTPEYRPAE